MWTFHGRNMLYKSRRGTKQLQLSPKINTNRAPNNWKEIAKIMVSSRSCSKGWRLVSLMAEMLSLVMYQVSQAGGIHLNVDLSLTCTVVEHNIIFAHTQAIRVLLAKWRSNDAFESAVLSLLLKEGKFDNLLDLLEKVAPQSDRMPFSKALLRVLNINSRTNIPASA
jgi:hypothetical protein